MYVPRAMYSFKTSFWTVPWSCSRRMPRRSATATTSDNKIIAVALIVIERLTRSSGIPCKSRSMSSIVEIATPARPTSPRARGWSASYPIWVGRSKATESPVWPSERR